MLSPGPAVAVDGPAGPAHTHTHGPLGFCPGLPRHQKGKTNLDLLEQDIVSGSGIKPSNQERV